MKDPKVQEAITRLRDLVAEINDLNIFFKEEGVHYSISSKGGTNEPITVEITYLSQSVKYD